MRHSGATGGVGGRFLCAHGPRSFRHALRWRHAGFVQEPLGVRPVRLADRRESARSGSGTLGWRQDAYTPHGATALRWTTLHGRLAGTQCEAGCKACRHAGAQPPAAGEGRLRRRGHRGRRQCVSFIVMRVGAHESGNAIGGRTAASEMQRVKLFT